VLIRASSLTSRFENLPEDPDVRPT